jgi:hypothetical protein
MKHPTAMAKNARPVMLIEKPYVPGKIHGNAVNQENSTAKLKAV